MTGETIHIDGGYPVDMYEKTIDLLRAAEHNEFEEFDVVYKEFGDVALKRALTASAMFSI